MIKYYIMKKTVKRIKRAQRAVQEKTITLILGAFALVAALAWNEAIKSLFEQLLKNSGTLIGKFVYALIVTGIVVIISVQLRKIAKQ